MARLVLGLGTGRCGSVTLTRLLASQPGIEAAHESWSPVAWDGQVGEWVERIFTKLEACAANILVEVAFYWLPYAEALLSADPSAKAIVLQRPRDQVIASYLRKVGPSRNHWSSEGRDPSDGWNQSYPDYAGLSKEQAIGRYWDDYYARVGELCERFPGRIHRMRTSDLNDPEAVRDALSFVGVENPDLSEVGQKYNAS